MNVEQAKVELGQTKEDLETIKNQMVWQEGHQKEMREKVLEIIDHADKFEQQYLKILQEISQ